MVEGQQCVPQLWVRLSAVLYGFLRRIAERYSYREVRIVLLIAEVGDHQTNLGFPLALWYYHKHIPPLPSCDVSHGYFGVTGACFKVESVACCVSSHRNVALYVNDEGFTVHLDGCIGQYPHDLGITLTITPVCAGIEVARTKRYDDDRRY